VPNDSPNSLELIAAARNGDRSAFGALYEIFGRMVHGILLTRVNHADADDLAQEVFVTAMKQLGKLREPEKFGGWLATIARNRSNDFLRRASHTADLPEEISVRETASSDAEATAALRAIRELPEAYRETLMLRLVEGMTGPEIAERTGLTPDSVRVNLHRGMKLLRERLKQ
jgi:RNA polymerase sigma-70 factor (ECF subfamily)